MVGWNYLAGESNGGKSAQLAVVGLEGIQVKESWKGFIAKFEKQGGELVFSSYLFNKKHYKCNCFSFL